MSLLLQALQKAAKNRESVQPDLDVSRSGLELEPGEIQPAEPSTGSSAPAFGDLPAASAGAEGSEPSPQQAAAVLGAEAREPRPRMLSGFNLRPVPLFVGAAAVFMLGYGVYVYIAISNPGMLSGAPRGEDRQPRPLAVRTAVSPGVPINGAPMPDILDAPPPGLPAAAPAQAAPPAPGANPEPAVAQDTPRAADESSSGVGPGETSAGARLSLSSADDLSYPPAPTPRVPAARKRPEATPRERNSSIELAQPERPKTRTARNVPAVPVEDRVKVQLTELPRGIVAQIEEAWGHAQRGRLAEAEAGYESVLALDQRNIDALLGLASIAWRQGRTERAGEYYGRVLELDPQNAAAHSGMIGLVGSSDPVASETRLREMISREPSGQLYFTLGNLHATQSQWAQAQRAYFQAFQTEPGNPDYAFNLAVSLDRLGQPKPALQFYRKAVELSLAQGRAGFDQKAAVARIGQLAPVEDGTQ